MNAYHLMPGAGIANLHRVNIPSRPLGVHEVRVQLHAASLNARDLALAQGQFPIARNTPMVPLSDGVGTVVEVGPAVQRFAVGDRVITNFYEGWFDGECNAQKISRSFGAQIDGTLRKEMAAHEDTLVRAPTGLSDAEAASLTCAAVTAWNALFVQGQLKPGSKVLVPGTGSVALWTVQLAKAAGLHVIVTSSSDDKLARAERLGARGFVNYRKNPEWQAEVLKQTGGAGVDLVLEVGGQETLARSLASTRFGGKVIVIGRVSGWDEARLSPLMLIGGNKTLTGITVGSRRMTEDLVQFIEAERIIPAIDSEFSFEEASRAYERLASGDAFGKVVIRSE